MKKYLFSAVIAFCLSSSPSFAGTISLGTQQTSQGLQPASQAIQNVCINTVKMSAGEKAAYNDVKDIIPDLFCCSLIQTQDERTDCLSDNHQSIAGLFRYLDIKFVYPSAVAAGNACGTGAGNYILPDDVTRVLNPDQYVSYIKDYLDSLQRMKTDHDRSLQQLEQCSSTKAN